MKQPSVSPMAVFLAPICMAMLVLSGCSAKEGVAWQDDKEFVLKSLQSSSAEQVQLQQRVELLDKRMLALEKTVAKQQGSIAAMTATLKAQKKQQGHSIAAKKAGVTKPKKKVLSKSAEVEEETLTTKIDKIDSDIQQAVVASKSADKSAEKNDYTAAYLALKSGRYDEATSSFQRFLKVYPDGEYADQAYYWLGESLLAKGKFLAAVEAFDTLTKSHPKSSKYQAGLLKLSLAYEQAGRLGDAKAVLQRLIDESPDSKAAERARLRLTALNKEN